MTLYEHLGTRRNPGDSERRRGGGAPGFFSQVIRQHRPFHVICGSLAVHDHRGDAEPSHRDSPFGVLILRKD